MIRVRLICLAIGTVLSILLVMQLLRGKKYGELTAALDGHSFPLSGLYGIGFAWNEWRLFSLRGKLRTKMVGEAKLIYDPKYAEFYATAVWAQVLTYVHIFLTLGFLLAGVIDFTLFALIGLAAAALFGYSALNNMKDDLEKRRTACVIELPEIVSTMALLINSGMVLRTAWETIAFSKEGTAYELMRKTCSEMENGMSEIDAIYKFGVMSNSQELKKFSSVLIQGIEKGSRDLSELLAKQSTEMWALKKQVMLQKGEAAGAKLLGPTAMIFVGIILVVAAGVIGMLL